MASKNNIPYAGYCGPLVGYQWNPQYHSILAVDDDNLEFLLSELILLYKAYTISKIAIRAINIPNENYKISVLKSDCPLILLIKMDQKDVAPQKVINFLKEQILPPFHYNVFCMKETTTIDQDETDALNFNLTFAMQMRKVQIYSPSIKDIPFDSMAKIMNNTEKAATKKDTNQQPEDPNISPPVSE